MLLAYLSFYARYFAWAGDFAWGDRYVSTAVELVALMAIPLLLKYRREAGRAVWVTGIVLLVASLLIQIESLMFWLPLEIYQEETLGHPTFVIALRAKNIVAFALGKMDAWGLNNVPMTQDPWDYVHITCWNFLPFLLRRVGEAPAWAVQDRLRGMVHRCGGIGGLSDAVAPSCEANTTALVCRPKGRGRQIGVV